MVVQLLEGDLKTSLLLKVRFWEPGTMPAFAERACCVMNLEDRQACKHGLETGRGGMWLNLISEQYPTLRETKTI
jgi:hypothetical protein